MNSYAALIMYLGFAELLRGCCLALIKGLTGPLSKVPGPSLMRFSPWPWNIQVIKGNTMNLAPELFSKYGDTVRVFEAPREVIFSSKNAVHKIIVEEDFLKSPQYESVRTDGEIKTLITERDRVAYRQKAIIIARLFDQLEPLMLQCVEAFTETLDGRCSDGQGYAAIYMCGMISNLTSDIMSATSFGGSFDSVRTNDTYMKNLFLEHSRETALNRSFPILKWLPFFSSDKAANMDKIIERIVSKRLNSEEQVRKDLLQIILDTHKYNPDSFTDKHLKEEMSLFMIADSDTTGTAAAFAALLLVNHQAKLKALKKEIDTYFISTDSPITFTSTQDLPYLNAVINKSQRVMPNVVSGLPRITTESTVIDKYEIPPKTLVTAWISASFKDPNIWPDPEDFVPERWLGNYKGVDADRKVFIPFSGGSRSCIGQQFALKELRLILATLIRKYDLSLIPGQSHEMKAHVVPYFTSRKYLVGIRPSD